MRFVRGHYEHLALPHFVWLARNRDIGRAVESLDVLQEKLADLESEFEDEVDRLQDRLDPGSLQLEEVRIPPRKSDIEVRDVALLWVPWRLDRDGIAEPLHSRIGD